MGGKEGDGNFGKKNQDFFLKWGRGRISSCRELYTPLVPGPLQHDAGGDEEAGAQRRRRDPRPVCQEV